MKFYLNKNFFRRRSVQMILAGVIVFSVLLSLALPAALRLRKEKSAAAGENAALLELREAAKTLSKKQPPIEDFFKNSQMVRLKLSPNGERLAYLKPFKNRMNIHVRRLHDPPSEKRITHQTDRSVAGFAWKENETLIYMKDFGGNENFHVFRALANGEEEKDLTPFSQDVKVRIVDFLDQVSEDSILISANKRKRSVFDVYRLNVKTGELNQIAENPGFYESWMTDHNGRLRVALSQEGLRSSVYYRETEEQEFQKIKTIDFKDSFYPIMFTFDNQNLYVSSNLGRDKEDLEVFSPKKNKVISILFSHPKVSVTGLSYSKKRKKLLSANYTTWEGKTEKHFLDAEHERIFRDLQAKIPGKEISIVSQNRAEDLFIISAWSDKSPGVYYLYDVQKQSLSVIANPRPWIKEQDMSEQRPIQYTARDGQVIHGYLTLPLKALPKNLPVVVNPHGGPWSRDMWGYSSETQFLSNRGYAVFQMNFRGSTGYGRKFWIDGFKQWGRRIQDDITDGVHWLIEEGIADKNRIAVYGASFGGYAVLAGMAFTPNLYACGVNYVGVSNIFTFFNSIPPYWESWREMMYEMAGHPEKDKKLLMEVSPLFSAHKIQKPLFVVHGANDPRVKKEEADQIVKALEKKKIHVPYLVKADEGHGFQNEENRLDFYSLMEAFLEKCLK